MSGAEKTIDAPVPFKRADFPVPCTKPCGKSLSDRILTDLYHIKMLNFLTQRTPIPDRSIDLFLRASDKRCARRTLKNQVLRLRKFLEGHRVNIPPCAGPLPFEA